MSRLTLAEIWIYPIKSLGGIRVKSARVFEKGLELDRRWMLIDDDNEFMTQRIYPRMSLFKLQLKPRWLRGPKFKITHGQDAISLSPSHRLITKPIRAKIWDDEVDVFEVDPEYSSWFSKRLGLNCRLVCFPENNPRPVDPDYQINHEQVSLADAYPL